MKMLFFFSFVVLPFLVSSILTVAIELLCHRWNLLDLPGHRKMQSRPIPRMGGLAIFGASVISCALGPVILPAAQFLGAVIVFFGGLIDDMTPRNTVVGKLAFQIPGSLVFALGVPLPTMAHPGEEWLCRFFIFSIIFFTINAANLMDNMNGLTGGLSAVILGFLSLIALLGLRDVMLAAVGLIVAGSVLGFGIRNFPGGHIFMGDQGSQFLGYLLSTFSVVVLIRLFEPASFMSFLGAMSWMGLWGFLFLADVLLVVTIRAREKRSLFVGDQCHLSHQLVRRGLTPTQAVTLLVGLQCLLSYLSFLLLHNHVLR